MGQVVSVGVDDGEGGIKNYPGRITWISSKAEFTPKVIQTREERVNLVYAIKILVENDGLLKIGMPGEVYFN
jgi:HlyD family secretion protein